MNIEIVKIEKPDGNFSIWIDQEENFNIAVFLKEISILGVDAPETVYQSFGPAEIIERYQTGTGEFFISREFDEFAGTLIYSDNAELMHQILELMMSSGHYHAR